MRALALVALAGCLVTTTSGDPSPTAIVGTVHVCSVAPTCGREPYDVTRCWNGDHEIGHLSSHIAAECHDEYATECNGLCFVSCASTMSPCLYYVENPE